MTTKLQPKADQNDIHAITAFTIDSRPGEVIAILRKNGVAITDDASTSQIQRGFGSLLGNASFRKDFSSLAAKSVKEDAPVYHQRITRRNSLYNAAGPDEKVTSSGSTGTDQTDSLKKASGSKSFSDTTLGKFLNSDNLSSILNSGLQVWSYKKTDGNVTGQINNGRSTYTQPPGGPPPPPPPPPAAKGSGLGVGAWIGIGLGTIALVTVIVVLVRRRKK
jgi:hypothetical protein